MILDMIAPDDRVFKPSFHIRINTTVCQLVIFRQTIPADPDSTATTDQNISPVFCLKHLRIMSFSDDINRFERTGQIITHGIEHPWISPLHMSFRRGFQPSANHQMIFTVFSFSDISTPIGPDTVFNTIINITRTHIGGSPCVGWQLIAFHRQKTIHKPGTFHQLTPLFGTFAFCYLRESGFTHK